MDGGTLLPTLEYYVRTWALRPPRGTFVNTASFLLLFNTFQQLVCQLPPLLRSQIGDLVPFPVALLSNSNIDRNPFRLQLCYTSVYKTGIK